MFNYLSLDNNNNKKIKNPHKYKYLYNTIFFLIATC